MLVGLRHWSLLQLSLDLLELQQLRQDVLINRLNGIGNWVLTRKFRMWTGAGFGRIYSL